MYRARLEKMAAGVLLLLLVRLVMVEVAVAAPVVVDPDPSVHPNATHTGVHRAGHKSA